MLPRPRFGYRYGSAMFPRFCRILRCSQFLELALPVFGLRFVGGQGVGADAADERFFRGEEFLERIDDVNREERHLDLSALFVGHGVAVLDERLVDDQPASDDLLHAGRDERPEQFQAIAHAAPPFIRA
jgi:hypothetical protein